MRVFGSMVKWVAAVAVVLAAGTALVVAAVLGVGWLTHGRHIANLTVGAFTVADGVRPPGFETLGAGEGCPDDRPVKIGIRNDSSRTLTAAKLKVQAFMPGHSVNLLYSSALASSDAIVEPGHEVTGCWSFSLPEPQQAYASAHYVATIQEATFQ